MDVVPANDRARFAAWFTPERPGPGMMAAHMARTGVGSFRADRLDVPQAVSAEVPGNVALRGDPASLPPDALDGLAGFVDAPAEWLPVLRAADPGVAPWDRVIFELPADVAVPRADAVLLSAADVLAIDAFEADGAWIHESWGGPTALAASGMARGVFREGRLVSIAATFYVGGTYEELGVVTESAHRGRGHSRTAAAALIADIRARGHVPGWSTSPDNTASLAVADRLGFRQIGTGVLYALRVPIPVSE
jgi:RimJ/RimL family protein N-acetyltransferase